MTPNSRTEVCITVDTEFSIGGTFAEPQRYEPVGEQAVRGAVGGREEGLGFLLDSFAAADIRATFFVETLQTCYFGDRPMGSVVGQIAAAGHDVQLHFHPCWLHFRLPDWRVRCGEASDACSGRSDQHLDDILSTGIGAFSRWGLDRPVAARTGNLDTDSSIHRALRRFSIPISSSIGLAIRCPREERLRLASGRYWVDGALEIPVLTFRAFHPPGCARLRALTITGCSWPEVEAVLWRARGTGISPVVVLTHPTEFIKHRDVQFRDIRRNRVNQRRLTQLLRFIRRNGDDFIAVTFRERSADWLSSGTLAGPLLQGSAPKSLGRMLQNFANDYIWAY